MLLEPSQTAPTFFTRMETGRCDTFPLSARWRFFRFLLAPRALRTLALRSQVTNWL